MLTILYTEAGLNFVRGAELPGGVDKYIKYGSLPDIFDAKKQLLPMVRTFRLLVKLRASFFQTEITVCQSLAAPFILGTDFCDWFVEATRSRKELVELDGGSAVPAARPPVKRSPVLPSLRNEQEIRPQSSKNHDGSKSNKDNGHTRKPSSMYQIFMKA